MAVFRIEKTRDYTVMSNYHLRDMSLSLKAKGLLSLMLSLPENWDYITYTAHYRCCRKKWRDFHMGNTNLVPYETIVRATNGEPEAVDEVLRHYSKRIRFAALENGHTLILLP